MALDVVQAFRTGLERAGSVEAVPIALAYAVVQVVSTVAVQSQGAYFADSENPAMVDTGLIPEGGPLALELPLGALTALSVLSVALLSLVSVLAMRSFVGEYPTDGSVGLATLWGSLALFTFPLLFSLGLAALVLPGVFFAVTMAFVPAFVALDGHSLLGAMLESWRLTRGNWLRVLLLLVAEFAVIVVVAVVGSIPAVAVTSVAPAAGSVVQAVFGGVSLTVVVAVLAAAFVQLRETSEEADEFADIDDELLP